MRECSAVQAACTCPRCARCAWCRASAASTRMPSQEDEFADVPVCGCATLPSLGGGDCDAETAVFVRTHCAQVGVPRGVCGFRTPPPCVSRVCHACVPFLIAARLCPCPSVRVRVCCRMLRGQVLRACARRTFGRLADQWSPEVGAAVAACLRLLVPQALPPQGSGHSGAQAGAGTVGAPSPAFACGSSHLSNTGVC